MRVPADLVNNAPAYRMAELAILDMKIRYPVRIQFIKSKHMFATDEIGEISDQFHSACDNIIRHTCSVIVLKGIKLEAGVCTPTKIQHIQGQTFFINKCDSML